eukprot:Rhum_TRINITY_DN2235_c0_g1::Rhum_TRINITY_DN2235_c0_g1_i1::g.6492::m.6492
MLSWCKKPPKNAETSTSARLGVKTAAEPPSTASWCVRGRSTSVGRVSFCWKCSDVGSDDETPLPSGTHVVSVEATPSRDASAADPNAVRSIKQTIMICGAFPVLVEMKIVNDPPSRGSHPSPFPSSGSKTLHFSLSSLHPDLRTGEIIRFAEVVSQWSEFSKFVRSIPPVPRRSNGHGATRQDPPADGVNTNEAVLSGADILCDGYTPFDADIRCGHNMHCVQLNIAHYSQVVVAARLRHKQRIAVLRSAGSKKKRAQEHSRTPASAEQGSSGSPDDEALDIDGISLPDLFGEEVDGVIDSLQLLGPVNRGCESEGASSHSDLAVSDSHEFSEQHRSHHSDDGGSDQEHVLERSRRMTTVSAVSGLPDEVLHVVWLFLEHREFFQCRTLSPRFLRALDGCSVMWADASYDSLHKAEEDDEGGCLEVSCLPSSMREEEHRSVVQEFLVFPRKLREKYLLSRHVEAENKRRQRRLRAKDEEQKRFLRRLRRMALEVLMPGVVLIVLSLLILSTMALISVNNEAKYRTHGVGVEGGNTFSPFLFRQFANLATAGALANNVYIAILAYFLYAIEKQPAMIVLAPHVAGISGTSVMMLQKAMTQTGFYTWMHCMIPVITGVSLLSVSTLYHILIKGRCSLFAFRHCSGNVLVAVLLSLPVTLTLVLASIELGAGSVQCSRIFWPVLLTVGAILPWPPMLSLYWLRNVVYYWLGLTAIRPLWRKKVCNAHHLNVT